MHTIIDCHVEHSWADPLEIFEHMPSGWRQYMIDHMPRQWHDHVLGVGPRPASVIGSTPLDYDNAYRDPLGDYGAGTVLDGAIAACSSYEELLARHLDREGIAQALLCHGTAMLLPGLPVPRLVNELVKAINTWTLERWLPRDPRLCGVVLVSTQVPALAAEEIRRVGAHERMVAVLLGSNGLGKPFGHPIHNPIFEAAEEMGLNIIVRAGGDELMETAGYPAAGGLPGTYSEFRALAPQSLMTHAASLIGQGVVQRYPKLKFLLAGASIGWITPFLWRFDTDFKAFRHDMLWLKETPSEVFQQKFLVGTGPLAFQAAGERFASYLEIDHRLSEIVCYASGYPQRDCSTPAETLSALPAAWTAKVLFENASGFLGKGSQQSRPALPPSQEIPA